MLAVVLNLKSSVTRQLVVQRSYVLRVIRYDLPDCRRLNKKRDIVTYWGIVSL